MTANAVQINEIVGKLSEDNLVMLQTYAEFLLTRQSAKPKSAKNGKTKPLDEAAEQRLKKLRQFAGDAKFPNAPTSKYDVYEQ